MRSRKKIKIKNLLPENYSQAVEISVRFSLKEPDFSFSLIRKSLVKLVAFCLIVALSWAGLSAVINTFAYFNDTETSSENTFTAGTLDFLVDSRKEDNRFQTYTQGGWGSAAHGNNPSTYRNANFDSAFPDGASIGNSEGYEALFTTSQAVENFLPASRQPRPFTMNHINPTSTEAGVLAGQILALTLNVGFDLYDPNFAESINNLEDFVVSNSDNPCYEMTVGSVLEQGNLVLAGLPSAFTPPEINECATWINEEFVDGGDEDGFFPGGSFSQFATIINDGSLDFQYTVHVEKTSGDDDFCNALNLEALLEGTTYYSGNLLGFISSPVVYSISTDEWKFIISLLEDADVEGSCGFDFVFFGWQTNLSLFGGFSDIERVDDLIYGVSHVFVQSDGQAIGENNGAGNDGNSNLDEDIPEDNSEDEEFKEEEVVSEDANENVNEETIIDEQPATKE